MGNRSIINKYSYIYINNKNIFDFCYKFTAKELDNETSYTSKCNTNKFILFEKNLYKALPSDVWNYYMRHFLIKIFFYVK
jgi:hypothetical protein